MDRTELTEIILKAIRIEQGAERVPDARPSRSCAIYSEEIFDLYVDSLLPEGDVVALENHLKGCLTCCLKLEAALKREKAVNESFLRDQGTLDRSLSCKLQHLKRLFEDREIIAARLYADDGISGSDRVAYEYYLSPFEKSLSTPLSPCGKKGQRCGLEQRMPDMPRKNLSSLDMRIDGPGLYGRLKRKGKDR